MSNTTITDIRCSNAKIDKQRGLRAYSDAFNHIIINVHGCGESGLDLACAIRLKTDLERAINEAAMADDEYSRDGIN